MARLSRQSRDTVAAAIVRASPPFIGRRPQLDVLERSLQAACGGHPQLVLLPGDAGIGKTRLLKELRAQALNAGIQVCFGRCYEDLSLPYVPFAEAFQAQLEQIARDARHPLNADAAAIFHLLRRDRLTGAPSGFALSPRTDPEKLSLFMAVSRIIIQLAQSIPLLVILDDLHWADRSSLELFGHTVFALADAAVRQPVALMMVGSYRPPQAGEYLARIVARLAREEICQTLELSGLGEPEVSELIRSLAVAHPAHQLVAAVSHATQGNPLFIQEVLHHLVTRGALEERSGSLVSTVAAADLRLPEEITSAIAARAEGLSGDCRRVLTLASFLGDRFALPALQAVSATDADTLLTLLEEAIHQHVLLSEGPSFQFAHPLVRHVFYNGPSAARRQRIHQHIAETLLRLYADDPDTHLLEVTHHLIGAGPAADQATLGQYAIRAGDEARRMFAWGQAAAYYEAALAAARSGGQAAVQDIAQLHHRAGFAHYRNMDVGPALDQYERAIAAYRSTGNMEGVAQALTERIRAKVTIAAVPYGTMIDVQPLQEVLDFLGDGHPALSGQIWAMLAQVYWTARQPDKGEETARRALHTGERIGDDRLCAEASHALALAQIQSLQVREALDSWRRCHTYALRSGDLWLQGWPLPRIPLALAALGRLEEAATAAAEARALTSTIHDWAADSIALAALASVAVTRGDFLSAEQHAAEAITMLRRSRYPWGSLVALPALACARCWRGNWAGAEEAIDVLVAPGELFDDAGPATHGLAWVYRQLVRAHAGATEDVRAQFTAIPLGRDAQSRTDTSALPVLCALAELADLLAMPALAQAVYEPLTLAAEREVVFSAGWGWVFLISRALGVAAMVAQRWDDAEARFQAAITSAKAAGARPELGRTYLDYARMLVARGGDRDLALTLLDQAITVFTELGMHPLLGQATRLADDLRGRAAEPQPAAQAQAATPGAEAAASAAPPLVILFTDMVGSTDLIQRLGDAAAQSLLLVHNTIIRGSLRDHGGSERNHTGDGVMVTFPSASSAIECAVTIQRRFAEHNRDHPESTLRVRIGINAGEPLPADGQLFGAAVNAAARICGRAQPSQILVADVVRQLTAGKGVSFIDRGRVALKGFAERFRVYEVEW